MADSCAGPLAKMLDGVDVRTEAMERYWFWTRPQIRRWDGNSTTGPDGVLPRDGNGPPAGATSSLPTCGR
jgi:hypothetical protein